MLMCGCLVVRAIFKKGDRGKLSGCLECLTRCFVEKQINQKHSIK